MHKMKEYKTDAWCNKWHFIESINSPETNLCKKKKYIYYLYYVVIPHMYLWTPVGHHHFANLY